MADQPATGPPQKPQGTEGDPIHVVSRKEDDPIHVVSRSAPSTGWAGVMSGVEEFDKEEIQGYKEDMDALLVFIGLFSAVLAGFLNGSYNSLKADPADLMLLVMTGMSIQAASYTIQGGFINSTAPAPTSLPPFEPTHNAVVVNILWTASLVASLSAASGAIFVKQWLRGYTASATSFALHRMRIRYFRRLALEDWHVLGIASVLPFLLQISLVLFFVGLCYFTADIHPSVKNTTFPLVSAWAFFFVSATLLPLFSARCPYKTPALDPLTTLARKRLRRVWEYGLRTLKPIGPQMEEEQDTSVPRVAQPAATFRIVTGIRQWAGRCISRLNDTNQPHDEISATKTNAFDLRILLQADRLHGNDEVVDAAISHAVLQSKPPWQDTIVFALQLLHNRLPSEKLELAEPRLVDLADLTPRAVAAVINIVNYVQPLVPQTGDRLSPSAPDAEAQAALWTAFLRVSGSFSQRYGEIAYCLKNLSQSTIYARFLASQSVPLRSTMVLHSMLSLICQRLYHSDLTTSVPRLQSFLEVYFEKLYVPGLFGAEQLRPWSDVLNAESLGPTVGWLTQRLKSDIASAAAGSSNDRSRKMAWDDTISLIVKLVAVAEDISNFFNIRGVALKSSKALRQFWISCFNYQLHESWDLVPQGGLDAEGLSNIKTAIAALASDPPPSIDGEQALKLCQDLCESLWDDYDDGRASNLVPAWCGVFAALTQLVQQTQVEDYDAARDLVNWCLHRIKAIDGINNSDDDVEYAAWLATFNPEDSHVTDEFISELLRTNPNPQSPAHRGSFLRLWRIRRLQSLSSNAQSQAHGTVIRETPVTQLVTSVASSEQENTSQPGVAVVVNEDAPVDETSHLPIGDHNLRGRNEASIKVHDASSSAPMVLPADDSTPEPVSTDPLDVISYADIHERLHTAVQGPEEAGSVEIAHAESNRDEEMTPHFEGIPTAAGPVINDEVESAAVTADPVEDAADPHQTEPAQDHALNSDQDQGPSIPNSATLDGTPFFPTEVANESRLLQGVRSDDGSVQPDLTTTLVNPKRELHAHIPQDPPYTRSSSGEDERQHTETATDAVEPMNTGGTSDSNREDERQCTETETTTPSRSDNDAAEPLNTRGTNNSENIVGVEHDDEDVGEDNTDRVSFESWSQWVAGQ